MSFIGYGNITPNSNVNPDYVNVDGSNYSAGLSSNEIPNAGLRGISNNVDAANASVITRSFKGGKSKKNNIHSMYKRMTTRRGGRKISRRRHTKRGGYVYKSKSRRSRTGKRTRTRGGKRRYRGGNTEFTNNFALGSTPLSPSNSALANPPIYSPNPNTGNCFNSYNHYTGVQN
jgi:hypothetical protein